MVEWHPVKDLLLPTSQKEWEQKFAMYEGTPEYRLRYRCTLRLR
jgi:hypothetical protein